MKRLPYFQRGKVVDTDESSRIIGAIKASQEHTETSLKALGDEQGKLRDTITKNHVEATRGFGELRTQVALVDQKLDTHLEACEVAPKKGSRAAKTTGIAGLGGSLVYFGNWLYEKINGN